MNVRQAKWLIISYFKRHRLIISILIAFVVLVALIVQVIGAPAKALFTNLFAQTRYTEGLIGPVNSVNPLFASSDSEKDLERLLFRGLTKTNVTGATVGDLAASWDADPSGREYIFHLKPNQHFQNGETITADDVAYTYNLAKNPKYESNFAAVFKDVEIEALDDQTVLFHLRDSFSPFLSLTDIGILPRNSVKHQLDRGVDLSKLNLEGLGSTNFRLASLDSGSAVLIKGGAFFTFRFYQSENDLATALKLGEIQAAAFTTHTDLAKWPNFQVFSSPMYRRFTGIFYNERSGVTANKFIRQALSLAVDKNKVISAIGGAGELAYSPINPLSWAASSNLRHYDLDTTTAAADLEKESWTGGPIRSKAGATLEISLSFPDSPQYRAIADQVAIDWAAIGVRALLNPLDTTTFENKVIGSKDFQAAIFTEEVGADPDQYVLWHTSQKNTTNITGVSLPKLDKAIEDGRVTLGQADRLPKYADFQRFLLDESPVTMLYYPKLTYVVSTKVQGVFLPPLGLPQDRLSNISNWKIQKTIL